MLSNRALFLDSPRSQDIYFLEVCIYAKACKNHDELFRIGEGEYFTCHVDEVGFRDMQRLLSEGPHPK